MSKRYVFCTAGEFAGRYVTFDDEDAERGIADGWAIDQEGEDGMSLTEKVNAITPEERAGLDEAYAAFVAEKNQARIDEIEGRPRKPGRPRKSDEEKAADAKARADAKAKAAADKKAADDAAALEAQRAADAKAAAKAAEDAAKRGDDAAAVAAIDAGVAANLQDDKKG